MGAEIKKIIGGIVADEPELNKLFQEVLSGIRDDINEAQQNVEMYLDAIHNSAGGKEMYGNLYNESLKIKGQARDKQLKFIDMFKDRVTKKEIINANVKKESDAPFDHSQLNKMIDEVNKGKKFETIKPVIEPILKQQPLIDHELDDVEVDEDFINDVEDEEDEYDPEYD